MSRRTFLLVTTTIVGVSAGSLAGALAEQGGNDALSLPGAQISLTDAIAAAEARTGGRASRAELERSADGWVYDIEIVADGAVSDIKVNPETGSVMSVSEDKVDHDEDDDEAED